MIDSIKILATYHCCLMMFFMFKLFAVMVYYLSSELLCLRFEMSNSEFYFLTVGILFYDKTNLYVSNRVKIMGLSIYVCCIANLCNMHRIVFRSALTLAQIAVTIPVLGSP